MKLLKFSLLIFTLSCSFASLSHANELYLDSTLDCVVTDQNRRYNDLFRVELYSDGGANIKYRRQHLATLPGHYGDLELVRGCHRARQVIDDNQNLNSILVNCESDGEEGILLVDAATLRGEIYFYMPKIGYPERTALQISCSLQ